MTPEILAEAARRESLRCIVCEKLPPETVVQAWAVDFRWLCAECISGEEAPAAGLKLERWTSTIPVVIYETESPWRGSAAT